MSLTKEAYQERKWGRFPALRQALEDKRIPDSYYGRTSVDDNVFDAFNRLLELSILIKEYDNDIVNMAQSIGREEIYNDLRMISDNLEGMTNYLKGLTNAIQENIHELSHKIRNHQENSVE